MTTPTSSAGSNISYFASLRNHLSYIRTSKLNHTLPSTISGIILAGDKTPDQDDDLISYTYPLKPQPSRYHHSGPPSHNERKLVQAPSNSIQIQINNPSSNTADSNIGINNACNDQTRKTLKTVKIGFAENKSSQQSSYYPTKFENQSESPGLSRGGSGGGSRMRPYSKGTLKGPNQPIVKTVQRPNLENLITRGKFQGIYDDRESKCIYNHLKSPLQLKAYQHDVCICKFAPIVQSPLKMTYTAAIFKKDESNSLLNMNGNSNSQKATADDGDDIFSGKVRNSHVLTRVRQKLTESRNLYCDYDHLIFEKIPKSIRKTSSLENIKTFRSDSSTAVTKPILEESTDDDYEVIGDCNDAGTIISELTDDFSCLSTGLTNLTAAASADSAASKGRLNENRNDLTLSTTTRTTRKVSKLFKPLIGV